MRDTSFLSYCPFTLIQAHNRTATAISSEGSSPETAALNKRYGPRSPVRCCGYDMATLHSGGCQCAKSFLASTNTASCATLTSFSAVAT